MQPEEISLKTRISSWSHPKNSFFPNSCKITLPDSRWLVNLSVRKRTKTFLRSALEILLVRMSRIFVIPASMRISLEGDIREKCRSFLVLRHSPLKRNSELNSSLNLRQKKYSWWFIHVPLWENTRLVCIQIYTTQRPISELAVTYRLVLLYTKKIC